ncbi:hypothetical protein BDR22DRAFT_961843 [Usnea florida]
MARLAWLRGDQFKEKENAQQPSVIYGLNKRIHRRTIMRRAWIPPQTPEEGEAEAGKADDRELLIALADCADDDQSAHFSGDVHQLGPPEENPRVHIFAYFVNRPLFKRLISLGYPTHELESNTILMAYNAYEGYFADQETIRTRDWKVEMLKDVMSRIRNLKTIKGSVRRLLPFGGGLAGSQGRKGSP